MRAEEIALSTTPETIRDALGIDHPCQAYHKIISLVPSTTETLVSIGVYDRVVGRTRYCNTPPRVLQVPAMGGTKQINLSAVIGSRPDIVFANKEENTKADIEQLVQHGVRVFTQFPKTPQDAVEGIAQVESLLNLAGLESERCRKLLEKHQPCPNPVPFIYLIWRKPWMAAATDTYVNSLLEFCGGVNMVAPQERYPVLSTEWLQQMAKRSPFVFCSSEPYPFKKKHFSELERLGFKRSRILAIDGRLCSWHGVAIGDALSYLAPFLERCLAAGKR